MMKKMANNCAFTNFINQFMPHNGASTPTFSLANVRTYARLVDVTDGDSIVCVVPVLGSYFKFPIRLKGIDTPELRSKDPAMRERAVRAREFLIDALVPGRVSDKHSVREHLNENVVLVYLNCAKNDKYGRVLADVYVHASDVMSVSSALIQNGLAHVYDGGAKTW